MLNSDQLLRVSEQLLPLLEGSVRRLLEFDPETRESLARMQGMVIAIDVMGVDRSLYLQPDTHGLRFVFDHDGAVQVRIRGTVMDFLGLLRSRVSKRPVAAGQIEISGDLAAAQQVQNLLGRVDIDWDEMLSRLVGDTAAHRLGRAANAGGTWLRRTVDTFRMNVSEYARHEVELVPERDQVDGFNADIDRLRDDADRLAERIRRLRQAAAGSPGR
jgi:ubiquinone biosynthesis protein UbiJ